MNDSVVRLQLVRGIGLSSDLISWWGGSYWGFSHADALMPDGTLIGARSDRIYHNGVWYPKGVQQRPAEYEQWKRRAIVTFHVQRWQSDYWERLQSEGLGAQYNHLNIIELILGVKPTPDKHGRWICSARQFNRLRLIGVFPALTIPDEEITPDHLYLMSQAVGAVIEERDW